jgi:transcriptional regulator with XRE-family HTH domain
MRKVDMTSAFGLVLKKHRTAKGMSQELLAEKADIHPIYVGYIERSVRNPTLNVAKAIANALGLTLSQMITEAEKIQKPRG